jgi:hypothetical protein
MRRRRPSLPRCARADTPRAVRERGRGDGGRRQPRCSSAHLLRVGPSPGRPSGDVSPPVLPPDRVSLRLPTVVGARRRWLPGTPVAATRRRPVKSIGRRTRAGPPDVYRFGGLRRPGADGVGDGADPGLPHLALSGRGLLTYQFFRADLPGAGQLVSWHEVLPVSSGPLVLPVKTLILLDLSVLRGA